MNEQQTAIQDQAQSSTADTAESTKSAERVMKSKPVGSTDTSSSSEETEKSAQDQGGSSTSAETEQPADADEYIDPNDRRGVRKRINELVKEKNEHLEALKEERQRNEEIARRLAAIEAQNKQTGTAQKSDIQETDKQPANELKPPERPTEDEYDDYRDYEKAREKYYEDLADYKAEMKTRAMVAELEKKQEEQEQKARSEERTKKMSERVSKIVNEGTEKYEDFKEVAQNKDIPMTTAMVGAILDSEAAADIMYHLGANMDIADRIARMDSFHVAKEIGKLEAQLTVTPPRRTTKAREPINPVNAGDGKARSVRDKNLSSEDRIALLRAQHKT